MKPSDQRHAGMLESEFIVLIAALTSIVAFSIDAMLPALSTIGSEYAIANENHQQLVIIAFAVSFGLMQIVFGPLSDSVGRKPVLYGGLLIFVLASIAAPFSGSFYCLIALRAVQGIGAAAIRVTTNAIVRDCFEGRAMARIMSFVFTVFMIVPILAPAAGQALVVYADWRWIFLLLGGFSALLWIWTFVRMSEPLALKARRKLSFKNLIAAFREVLGNRVAFGYAMALTLFFGGLLAFVSSIAQIVDVVFNKSHWFAGVFAVVAGTMAIGSFSNGALVERLGMRRISHISVIAFTFAGLILLAVSLMNQPPIWLALPLIALIMMNFGLIAGNFNSLAMEPLGHISGAASSIIGTITFTGGALLGGFVGQQFDGTLTPLALSYSVFGSGALLIVFIVERGKLFDRRQ